MSSKKNILLLPGDGIGPEVINQVKRLINWLNKKHDFNAQLSEDLIGGAAYDKHGTPLADQTLQLAMDADAVLLGAVGGPQWDDLPFDVRPERGLLKIRKEMGLFANLRPALVFSPLASASSLKENLVTDLDLMIVRELTGGIYFGHPRGIDQDKQGLRQGYNTLIYNEKEIQRIAQVAFDLAGLRGQKLCSVDKANVLESSMLWREVMIETATQYPDVKLSHMYVDNMAMQLVRAPKQFDVIVTGNMFGDILSDCAAMLTGSLGMLPSASLGEKDSQGKQRALYEPVHGSAPDIQGQNIANPLAAMLSFSMMLRYSFNEQKLADLVEKSITQVLNGGLRTGDIMQPGMAKVSTTVMADAILNELDKLSA